VVGRDAVSPSGRRFQLFRIACSLDLNEGGGTVDIAKIVGGEFNFKRSKVFVKARQLRLREARRLMLTEQLDAATAAFQVGYESPSQFSREYNRQFGAPPLRDITNLRQLAVGERG